MFMETLLFAKKRNITEVIVMAKFTVKILITDKFLKKGVKDFTFNSNSELDDLREFIYFTYFRNPQLREKFYSATIKQGNNVVGDVFVTRNGEGRLEYVFAGPNFKVGSPLYILNKKSGKVRGRM